MDKRPFSLTADLGFLYLSEEHVRVFEEIHSAVNRRDGLICVTGEPGTGKTIICRRILEELGDDYNVVLVTTPPRTPQDMTETLDDAFGEVEGDKRVPVAIFDEAQHLDFRCLDHVKFLTNLERNGDKLLQIILVGQPELAEKLSHKRFSQLEQRIGAKLKLGALHKREVLPYLNHRLSVAGIAAGVRFTEGSARRLYRESAGIPRLINRIANIAVESVLQNGKGKIGVAEVRRATSKVNAALEDWTEPRGRRRLSLRLSVLLFLMALSIGAYFYLNFNAEQPFPILRGFVAETQGPAPSGEFLVKVGNFVKKEEADALRKRLEAEDLKATVATKDLGEGWIFYQVRLSGPYSRPEAENLLDLLWSMGLQSADKVPINP